MTEVLGRTDRDIRHAAALLAAGELVAFGTETVYGLGADAGNARAVAAVFAAKGRPHFNPLICHYGSAAAAFADVYATDAALRLAEMFWPGPLTMVLPRRVTCNVALLAGAGLETLAVRVPAHGVAQRLIAALGRPVAAPSANRSGQVSPTSAAHVLAGLDGRIAAVIDSGPCLVGVESSVVDLTGAVPVLLRPGGVSLESLRAAVGAVGQGITPAQAEAARGLRSPGLLVSHYAPALPLRMNAATVRPNEALLAFGAPLKGAGVVFQLSAGAELHEAAAQLFEGLRWLDAQIGAQGIAVMPVPEYGLGLAINDRLSRAAAPRG
jgi:L-threonylcarbamoyladenylate synthase